MQNIRKIVNCIYHKKTSKQHYKIISSGTEQNNHETNDATYRSML